MHLQIAPGAQNMRTRFTQHPSGAVTVEYDRADDESRVERTFFCRGSYVYESGIGTADARQVCDALATRGSTLSAPRDPQKLINIIRHEYRAMRRAERKERAYL